MDANYFDQGVAFIIPVLVALLQLMYQGNSYTRTPFETHPRTMRVAVVTSFLYYFTYGLKNRSFLGRISPKLVTFTHHGMVCLGDLSVASLGSIFFGDSWRPFLYVLCFLLSASEGLYRVYQKFVEESEELQHVHTISYIRRWFLRNSRRFIANYSLERPQILPR